MAQLLVIFCCFLACPLIMGGMMWFIGRDGQAKRLEREIRRLNRQAARRAAASQTVEGPGIAAPADDGGGSSVHPTEEPDDVGRDLVTVASDDSGRGSAADSGLTGPGDRSAA